MNNRNSPTTKSKDDPPLMDSSVSEKAQEYVEPVSKALREAKAVIDAIGGEHYLDGFNLLGVVANPRGYSSMSTSSYHGRFNKSGSTSISTNAMSAASSSPAPSSDMFTDTYNSLEVTLSQVTEQMEALNYILEEWSRKILEEDPYAMSEELPESQLTELPVELVDLNLQGLRAYLEQSGVAAAAFERILLYEFQQQRDGGTEEKGSIANAATTLELPSGVTAAEQQQDVAMGDIPSILFEEDFDLTHPQTFCELLIKETSKSISLQESAMDDSVPIFEWFPLLPPDSFGPFLDKVELALLHQVRSKSRDFFTESLRFAQLQEWITELLVEVTELQNRTKRIRTDLLDPLEQIPIADAQRQDLQRLVDVVEQADELLQCKSGIGGILSAQDDLSAIEQIQYGRRLLTGSSRGKDGDDHVVELGRLTALKTVAVQLDQFEELVVSNLRDELVEIFMGWNSDTVSNVYAVNVPSSSEGTPPPAVRQRVGEIVEALSFCKGLPKTKEVYGSRLQDVIRMTVRTTVTEFASDEGVEPALNVTKGATAMSLRRFMDCLDMLFEQLLGLVRSASGVGAFCVDENISFDDEGTSGETLPSLAPIISSAADLCSKSISELLRIRKEAHSLITLEEMKSLWASCLTFVDEIERVSGSTSALRSTLLAQAKSFVERKHESNMSALVAALNSERWTQCEVSAERQSSITRLCSGRALVSSSAGTSNGSESETCPEVEVEGKRYRVVWSCLLLIEMLLANIQSAAYFPGLASNLVGKVSDLLRLFNARTTQLVLGAGAIKSSGGVIKSINAKHLSMVTQCLGISLSIIPHVRAALTAQLPKRQHPLLSSLEQITKEYMDHNEKVLNKFVLIIGGIVEHGLSPKIAGTDFDARAKSHGSAEGGTVKCCVFLDGVSTNTKKMHQVLCSLLPPDHLRDVFSRIFAFVDRKLPSLFVAASQPKVATPPRKGTGNGAAKSPSRPVAAFRFPVTVEGKRQMLVEVDQLTRSLNSLEGVVPWDFTVATVLERKLEYRLKGEDNTSGQAASPNTAEPSTSEEDEASRSPQGDDEIEAPANEESARDEDVAPVASEGGPVDEAGIKAPYPEEGPVATEGGLVDEADNKAPRNEERAREDAALGDNENGRVDETATEAPTSTEEALDKDVAHIDSENGPIDKAVEDAESAQLPLSSETGSGETADDTSPKDSATAPQGTDSSEDQVSNGQDKIGESEDSPAEQSADLGTNTEAAAIVPDHAEVNGVHDEDDKEMAAPSAEAGLRDGAENEAASEAIVANGSTPP